MFVLTVPMHRNGAVSREHYQPDPAKSDLPGIVFGSLLFGEGKARAKQYVMEEEARADIPNWVEATKKHAESRGSVLDEALLSTQIRVEPV